MPRKKATPAPTDAEIMQFDNVPPEVAAHYIGWSSVTIYNALKQERAPFGIAVQNPETGTWTYNISPGALVKYKNGDLPAYRLGEVIKLAADGIQEVLDLRAQAAISILRGGLAT